MKGCRCSHCSHELLIQKEMVSNVTIIVWCHQTVWLLQTAIWKHSRICLLAFSGNLIRRTSKTALGIRLPRGHSSTPASLPHKVWSITEKRFKFLWKPHFADNDGPETFHPIPSRLYRPSHTWTLLFSYNKSIPSTANSSYFVYFLQDIQHHRRSHQKHPSSILQ